MGVQHYGFHFVYSNIKSNYKSQCDNIRLGPEERVLSWDERLQIALDISHGIEYLHDGVCQFFS